MQDGKQGTTQRRSALSRVVAILVGTGLYGSLFLQPACPGDSDDPQFADAGYIDAPAVIDSAPPPSDSAPTDSTTATDSPADSAPTVISACWTAVAAKKFYGSSGPPICGILSTQFSAPGGVVTAGPFGSGNQSVAFSPANPPGPVSATSLIILDAGSHTCTLTCIERDVGAPIVKVHCTNPGGGVCDQDLSDAS